jgi:carbon storage regulator
MLVLSRQRDETIMIGDDVEITVVDIRGDKVRLGITAPRHIQVHRKEVYDAIKRENQQAAGLTPKDVSDVVGKDSPSNGVQGSGDVSGKPTTDPSRSDPNRRPR